MKKSFSEKKAKVFLEKMVKKRIYGNKRELKNINNIIN